MQAGPCSNLVLLFRCLASVPECSHTVDSQQPPLHNFSLTTTHSAFNPFFRYRRPPWSPSEQPSWLSPAPSPSRPTITLTPSPCRCPTDVGGISPQSKKERELTVVSVAWCNDQTSSCPTICLQTSTGEPQVNTCDAVRSDPLPFGSSTPANNRPPPGGRNRKPSPTAASAATASSPI
jgi:hypothetical protein